MIIQIAEIARARKCSISHRISRSAELTVKTSDISARDNVSLATASGRIYDVFAALRDRAMVDDAELLRIVYRFAGEVIDVEDMLRAARPLACHYYPSIGRPVVRQTARRTPSTPRPPTSLQAEDHQRPAG